ncbi:HAMP domain-containing protein [Desulfopila inferna]|uniref:HAMP domain-containing protein n=1 Tax=Desulfopila inferna TaxID=468528 RepID=UPI00196380DB|nr:cache and HAMP domain-containing protein [Desulfopila inferna]MBM9603245.1 HAMP domain-containing protein [Desulfopila inferna]
MVVICEECGLKYQIDPSKIVGDKARFKCKGCSSSIIVDKTEYMTEDDDMTSLEDALLMSELDKDTSRESSRKTGNAAMEADGGAHAASVGRAEPAAAMTSAPAEKKKRSGFGLTAKVILMMLLVSLIPGAIYFALSLNQTSTRIIAETNKTGELVSGLLASEVDEWIDKNVRVLQAFANIPAIKSMNGYEQEILLKALQAEYPWMYLVFTTDEQGMNIARNDGNPLTDYSNRQYVKDVVGGAELAWQNAIGKTSKKPALIIGVPIKNGDTIVGVLAAAMTRDTISELITTFSQGRTGSSFLVDETGKAVAHRNNAFVTQQENMSSHPLVKVAGRSGGAGRVEFVDANGKDTIGFAERTKLGWTLAIQQEKEEAFEPLEKARIFAFSLLAGTVFAILIISYFASRAIVTPIRKLTDAANRISIGDLDVEISTSSKDEIGDLAAAIMRMQDSIRLSISRLTRKRR